MDTASTSLSSPKAKDTEKPLLSADSGVASPEKSVASNPEQAQASKTEKTSQPSLASQSDLSISGLTDDAASDSDLKELDSFLREVGEAAVSALSDDQPEENITEEFKLGENVSIQSDSLRDAFEASPDIDAADFDTAFDGILSFEDPFEKGEDETEPLPAPRSSTPIEEAYRDDFDENVFANIPLFDDDDSDLESSVNQFLPEREKPSPARPAPADRSATSDMGNAVATPVAPRKEPAPPAAKKMAASAKTAPDKRPNPYYIDPKTQQNPLKKDSLKRSQSTEDKPKVKKVREPLVNHNALGKTPDLPAPEPRSATPRKSETEERHSRSRSRDSFQIEIDRQKKSRGNVIIPAPSREEPPKKGKIEGLPVITRENDSREEIKLDPALAAMKGSEALQELLRRRMSARRLVDLQKLIGVDDGSLFLRKLFRNQEIRFRDFINLLNYTPDWDQAFELIDRYFDEAGIDPFSREALLFTTRVYIRYFSRDIAVHRGHILKFSK